MEAILLKNERKGVIMIKLKPVKKIPESERYCCRHDLQAIIKNFVNSNTKICEFKFEVGVDYKSSDSAYWSIKTAVRRSGENIKAYIRNKRVYLEKQVEN